MAAELERAYRECQQTTRRAAKNFYYAFLTLPPADRQAIYVVYSFCRYCDDAVDSETSADRQTAALHQLGAALTNSYAGQAETPVFLALADVARRYAIPEQYFREVLAGVESDLTTDRYRDFAELRQYCYRVAAVVGLICLQIFGYRDDRAKEYAIDLGLAMQLTNICRDVKEDWEMGRVYLPQEELAHFGYTEADLAAGICNAAFGELMRFQVRRAREYFARGRELLPYLTPRSRACPAALGGIYGKVLDRIEAADYDVLHRRVQVSTAAKLRVMAQAWLGSLAARPRRP